MEAPLSQDLQLKSHWLRQLDRLKSHCLRCLWWCWCILCVFFFSFCSRKRLGSEGSQALHSHGFTVDIVLLRQSQCWFVQNHCGWVFSKSSWPSLFDMFWPLKVLGVYILHSPFLPSLADTCHSNLVTRCQGMWIFAFCSPLMKQEMVSFAVVPSGKVRPSSGLVWGLHSSRFLAVSLATTSRKRSVHQIDHGAVKSRPECLLSTVCSQWPDFTNISRCALCEVPACWGFQGK